MKIINFVSFYVKDKKDRKDLGFSIGLGYQYFPVGTGCCNLYLFGRWFILKFRHKTNKDKSKTLIKL